MLAILIIFGFLFGIANSFSSRATAAVLDSISYYHHNKHHCQHQHPRLPNTINAVDDSLVLRMSFGDTEGDAGKNKKKRRTIPKPKVITPEKRSMDRTNIEKFLMMYTCKVCQGRNAQMVSKLAYSQGMVISKCKSCKNHHLIADNEGKLDFPEYGKRIDEYLTQQGEQVQKLSLSPEDLERNYLIDKDGVLTLVPKMSGQPDPDVTIVEFPTTES